MMAISSLMMLMMVANWWLPTVASYVLAHLTKLVNNCWDETGATWRGNGYGHWYRSMSLVLFFACDFACGVWQLLRWRHFVEFHWCSKRWFPLRDYASACWRDWPWSDSLSCRVWCDKLREQKFNSIVVLPHMSRGQRSQQILLTNRNLKLWFVLICVLLKTNWSQLMVDVATDNTTNGPAPTSMMLKVFIVLRCFFLAPANESLAIFQRGSLRLWEVTSENLALELTIREYGNGGEWLTIDIVVGLTAPWLTRSLFYQYCSVHQVGLYESLWAVETIK